MSSMRQDCKAAAELYLAEPSDSHDGKHTVIGLMRFIRENVGWMGIMEARLHAIEALLDINTPETKAIIQNYKDSL